jgi:hypothetical protein
MEKAKLSPFTLNYFNYGQNKSKNNHAGLLDAVVDCADFFEKRL